MPDLELARTLSSLPTPYNAGEIMRTMIQERGLTKPASVFSGEADSDVKDPVQPEADETPVIRGDLIEGGPVHVAEMMAGLRDATPFSSMGDAF